MALPEPDFHLASASPRRRELLLQLGYRFTVLPVDIAEIQTEDEAGEDYVLRVARDKALAGLGLRSPGDLRPVLGADTEVLLDARALGKPGSRADALAMLGALSGRAHLVVSAVAVNDGSRERVVVSRTRVVLRHLEAAEVEAYWASGEPSGKAGGYAIQGLAAAFIERIEGSYTGVVGLPLFETAALLGEFGVLGWQRDYTRRHD
jgi:septum formation protein